MNKLLLTGVVSIISSLSLTFAVPTEAEYANMLKSQQQAITKDCFNQLKQNNPKADAQIKKSFEAYCSCYADNLSSNKTYVKKLHNALKTSKSQQEHENKTEQISREVEQMCQAKLAPKK